MKNLIIEIISCLEKERDGFNFITTRNGAQITYSCAFDKKIYQLTELIQSENKDYSNIELQHFHPIVRKSFLDLYSEKIFANFDHNSSATINNFKDDIKKYVLQKTQNFTHYIPARTIGFANIETLKFDNAEIMSIETWLDTINIKWSKDFVDYDWRTYIKEYLQNNISEAFPSEDIWMLMTLISSIENANSIVKITICGYEDNISIKLSRIIAKTILDTISLLFNNSNVFYQQLLTLERQSQVSTYTIVEKNGLLARPGIELGKQVQTISGKSALTLLKSDFGLDAIKILNKIITSQINENEYLPKLASRWTISLDWYADGIREPNDAIALAKIATSLDILTKGSKSKNIINALCLILKKEENEEVLKAITKSYTLKKFIERIYDYGRSQILHGNHNNRLKSFSEDRKLAIIFTRIVLIECIFLLDEYSGQDTDEGFGKLVMIKNQPI